MFYAQFVLSKRGPLAKIWLAAHWEKKLTKAQVYETDVEKAVNEILEPSVKMALRTTGHLLLGVVRIYSRKAKYLLADCNEAFLKIKMAFRPGQVDLPEDAREANYNAITLPEVFHDFDSALPDFNEMEFQQSQSLNQSRFGDITMKEDLPKASHGFDSQFGLGSGLDDFGDAAFDDDDMEIGREGDATLLEANNVAADSDLLNPSVRDDADIDAIPDAQDFAMDDDFMSDIFNEETMKAMEEKDPEPVIPVQITHSDSFQLESLDTTVVAALEKHRVKRKRKLIVDDNKNISGEEMKSQMSGSNDTIGMLDLAPPTRKLMQSKEICLPDKLCNNASSDALQSKHLLTMLVEQLIPHAREEDASVRENLIQALQLAKQAEIDDADEQKKLATIAEVDESDNHMGMLEDLGNVPSVSPVNAVELAMSPVAPESPPPQDKTKDKKDISRDNTKKERKSRQTDTSRCVDDSIDDGEDVDEKRQTKRTHQVLAAINNKLKNNTDVAFSDLTRGATRKSAAQKFYTLLALKKQRAVELVQNEPFGEIGLVPGPEFNQCMA